MCVCGESCELFVLIFLQFLFLCDTAFSACVCVICWYGCDVSGEGLNKTAVDGLWTTSLVDGLKQQLVDFAALETKAPERTNFPWTCTVCTCIVRFLTRHHQDSNAGFDDTPFSGRRVQLFPHLLKNHLYCGLDCTAP